MSNPSTARSVLDDFITSVDEIGLARTAAAIRSELDRHRQQNGDDARFVVAMVGKTFKIPVQEILHGVTRKNERKHAIGFCVYYLHHELQYEMDIVMGMLNKSKWICYKYSKLVHKLSPENQADKKYLHYKKLFDVTMAQRPRKKTKKVVHGTK
jgi:hypothetical protein